MVETVQTFSVCHNITDLRRECLTKIEKEHLGVKLHSASSLLSDGGLFTYFHLSFTSENGTDQKSTKITVTLTNRSGEQFVETYVQEQSMARYWFDADKVGSGEELVTATLNFDVEVTGVFQEKPKTREFGASDPILTDVVLVAEGQKFHVNKAILTTHSPHFRYLLATGNGEFQLKNITAKDLQDVLQVIYHHPEIYDYNVEELLEAARQLDVPLVTRSCKKHLKKSSCWIVDEDKKLLVKEYDLDFMALFQGIPKDFGIRGDLDDVVLKVEDQRFHVNRGILATHSPYFYTMFFGGFRESGQSEIELKSVDPVTFQQLLQILYHCPDIHENNVENLLHLARIYDAQPVTAQCEKFINGENALPKEEKQRLTEEYFPK